MVNRRGFHPPTLRNRNGRRAGRHADWHAQFGDSVEQVTCRCVHAGRRAICSGGMPNPKKPKPKRKGRSDYQGAVSHSGNPLASRLPRRPHTTLAPTPPPVPPPPPHPPPPLPAAASAAVAGRTVEGAPRHEPLPSEYIGRQDRRVLASFLDSRPPTPTGHNSWARAGTTRRKRSNRGGSKSSGAKEVGVTALWYTWCPRLTTLTRLTATATRLRVAA